MASLKDRAAAAVARLRATYPWLDHVVRMVQHYGAVNGNAQAGAVTFFGFLSFFPILALGFFVIGLLAQLYPDLKDQMVVEINKLVPGVIGSDPGQIKLSTIESYSGTIGIVGLVVVVYAGLGWLSGMRQALEVMFVVPRQEQPNFLVGKLRDLGTLVLVGLTLTVSVALSAAVTGFTGLILGWVGIDSGSLVPTVLVGVVGHALALAASTVLLLTMFRLLVAESHVPRGALLRGALLGAVGFEVLKLGANLLLKQTQGNPAFQVFGVTLILLVWINYFSRLVMYAAAWAYTATTALERRTTEAMRAPGAALALEAADTRAPAPAAVTDRPWAIAVAAGAGALLGAALMRVLRGGTR
ncbi:YihY/virulence factor BrkB family protein [Nocardioides panacis]|uniref:YihY/virulence factor BrkB family protein n=1 Tax=Nocardioides panacis TaxID=2849501 RepID=A0A975SW07_9ACTN|nr:YihY/virulence factor BrkB family protein [Nocardioides panacis]QWZ06837.1 YihY/virulence factor BrkB family protein [Nocardioides panacis]